ncbi:MAG: apolipoprotein N-acyltransferase [Prolixibacteraceae bacterium]|nr:apolipoprotein N-acyltransferase [Prolixibacteraceae bacterium]
MSVFQRFLLAVSSGILLSLAWLGFPGWILFAAFIPLLNLEQIYIRMNAGNKIFSLWGYFFLTFLVWNGITTWWIAYATVPGAVLAVVANSFLMSVVWLSGYFVRLKTKANLGYIALIVFWISFEYFHYHWDIEWPWLNLGNGFANNVRLIQWYEYTGAAGGTLWVLVMNVLIYKIIFTRGNNMQSGQMIYSVISLALVIVVPAAVSMIIYHSYTEEEDPVNVVIVQPNIDPYAEQYDNQTEREKMQKFILLADSKITGETDLVVGPETVFERQFDWNLDRLPYNHYFTGLTSWILNYPSAELILGASTSKIYPDAESASETARVSKGIYYDVFNSALFIGRDGKGQIYHKSVLVPGVEKMPFRKYLGFLNDLVFDLGGTTGSLGRQDEPSGFILKDGNRVAPAICYESVFGEYLSESVKQGAGLIIIITNDGWWRNTPGYKQHFSFARLRAVETRRSIVRSANTGISCLINQRGDVLLSTGWWEETAVNGTVNYNYEDSFYTKYGDYISRISLFISALLILFMIVQKKSAPIPFA